MKVFFEEFIRHKFNIIDYWFRYEWQSRGSTHAHGLYWVNGSPVVDPTMAMELQQQFADFWSLHVTGFRPQTYYRVAHDAD